MALKELDIIRVQSEIAALRVVTPILAPTGLKMDLLLLRNSPQQGPQAERRRLPVTRDPSLESNFSSVPEPRSR